MPTKRVAGLNLIFILIMLLALQVTLASATSSKTGAVDAPVPDAEDTDLFGSVPLDDPPLLDDDPPAGVPTPPNSEFGDSNHLEAELSQPNREKASGSNPQVLLACLASLDRLRGHLSTRWFAPSDCPTENR